MRTTTALMTAATVALLVAPAAAANAAPARTPVEMIDRSAFATTFESTEGTLHLAGATRGELGGYLDVVVTAVDGTLPTGSNVCETAAVTAVLTLSPGETLATRTRGDVCTGFAGDSLTVNAAVTRKKQLSYRGSAHRKARLAGDGLVAASVVPGLGGQASFFVPVRWRG